MRKSKKERGKYLEIQEHNYLRLFLEYMDISLSVSLEEAEIKIMNGISQGAVMPYADIMLDYLNAKGIRTGVISNNYFSGAALKERFDRLLPGNRFEFVLVSSDYIFRKPHSMMFEIALQKSGLTADKVCTAAIVWKMTFTEQMVLECFLFYMKEEQRMKHIFYLIKAMGIFLISNICLFMTGGR